MKSSRDLGLIIAKSEDMTIEKHSPFGERLLFNTDKKIFEIRVVGFFIIYIDKTHGKKIGAGSQLVPFYI